MCGFSFRQGRFIRDTTGVRIADVVAAPLINNEINDRRRASRRRRREREGRAMTRDDNERPIFALAINFQMLTDLKDGLTVGKDD